VYNSRSQEAIFKTIFIKNLNFYKKKAKLKHKTTKENQVDEWCDQKFIFEARVKQSVKKIIILSIIISQVRTKNLRNVYEYDEEI
jgi:hypothetical protein